MHHMDRATVRDLRYRFPEVEARLRQGETVEITKHKRVIARLVPERPQTTPAVPPFASRLKKIFGKKTLRVTGAELVRAERDEGN